jgi:acetolactate synthase I/II/III large subunit
MTASKPTTGAVVAMRTLAELGVETSFGVPGVHALPAWEALRGVGLQQVGARTELGAAFAADGYARASGRPAALLLSTGPGALISLAGLMEAAASYVPLVAIASQIDSSMIGAGRGALHELADQVASFSPIVKWSGSADSVESIPTLVTEAWEAALRPPRGPAFLEIPVDLLGASADAREGAQRRATDRERVSAADADRAMEMLASAHSPLIWSGGGTIRAGAEEPLVRLAELLDAPVATTFMGKGAIPETHPLAVGSACDEPPFKALIAGADAVLCIGTELGEEASSAYTIEVPASRLVRVDASETRLAATGAAATVLGDAVEVLGTMIARAPRAPAEHGGATRAAAAREQIEAHLRAQDREPERELLRAIRRALPAHAIHCWDMTILGYWAARDFPAIKPRRFLYPVGSGTLGYAWPAAIGAAIAEPDTPVLAVAGDGGLMYSIAELASARQAGVDATLLVVDDGAYGILREYQRAAYGDAWGVDLVVPDLMALSRSFGVGCRRTSPEALEGDLEWAIDERGPTVLVLRETLRAPTTMD